MQTKLSSDVKEMNHAIEQAKKQREISISEFFTKNRHLLGFDSPLKALSTTIKEGVDNSLDATTEADILPDIKVEVKQTTPERFLVTIEDNGPGIVKDQIPKIFGKLLYGSKFHKLKQSIGQQGIGICMSPETLVPLGDGRVLPIEKIVYEKPNSDIFTLMPDLKLGLGKINKFWEIPSPPYLIRLKTLGGREIDLTPENPVLIRNESGFSWKDAKEVNSGDFIAISRKLGTHIQRRDVVTIDFLDNGTTRVDNQIFEKSILDKLKKKYGTWKNVSKRFNIKLDQIMGWRKKNIRRRPTLKLLKDFCNDLEISREELIKNSQRVGCLGNYVKVPTHINEDFMTFLGYISADGYSQPRTKNRWGRNISFWNNDNTLREDFRKIVRDLFDIEAKEIPHSKGRGIMVQFSSSLIAKLINSFDIPSGKKHDIFNLNPVLQRKDLLKPYLRAMYDSEGSVNSDRNEISFMIRNKNMTKQISLFLLQFGIIGKINKISDDIRIVINGEYNLKKFANEIGFRHKDKKRKLDEILINGKLDNKNSSLEKVPYIKEQLRKLRDDLGVDKKTFPNYIVNRKGNKTVTLKKLEEIYPIFLEKLENKNVPIELQELKCILESDIIWVPITKKKRITPTSNYVYDLTMQHGNNFIANGILVHNSASVLYGQLTTGRPAKITSKISPKKPAHYYEIHFDTVKNEPEIDKDIKIKWDKNHGTKVEIEMEGKYQRGKRSVPEYMKYVAIANPHATLTLVEPDGNKIEYPRATTKLPIKPKEIKPHPDGIELGILINMLKSTKARTCQSFLSSDFSRISSTTARKICESANLYPNARPSRIAKQEADNLLKAIRQTKFMAPSTDCLSPIGQDLLLKSLQKEFDADFFTTITRPASVYRGNPFIIECGICYGGSLDKESPMEIIRFANKVPLQYQQAACSITKSIVNTKWKQYGLQQSGNNIPVGSVVLAIHIASVWVPFTSESKEAIAHYPEIIKEIKLAVQECGRQLGKFLRRQHKERDEAKKKSYLEKYVPVIGEALREILSLKQVEENRVNKNLKEVLEKSRK